VRSRVEIFLLSTNSSQLLASKAIIIHIKQGPSTRSSVNTHSYLDPHTRTPLAIGTHPRSNGFHSENSAVAEFSFLSFPFPFLISVFFVCFFASVPGPFNWGEIKGPARELVGQARFLPILFYFAGQTRLDLVRWASANYTFAAHATLCPSLSIIIFDRPARVVR